MRIFLTGASGYVGQALADHAMRAGHSVVGLCRSETSRDVLERMGVTPMLGDLLSLDGLENEIAEFDAVFHLAFIHDSNVSYQEVLSTDHQAMRALAKALAKSNKPLVTTSGTAFAEPARDGGETDEWAPTSDSFVMKDRVKAERAALALADEGVRVSALRLPPYVYGRGGSTFVPLLMRLAADRDVSAYVGDGMKQTSAVHVDDAARCYLLAAEKAPAGSVFNCTSQTDITARQLAEAIGTAVDVPVKSKTRAEVEELWGRFTTDFVDYQNRASSARARTELGWEPREPGLVEDITRGSYHDLASSLRRS